MSSFGYISSSVINTNANISSQISSIYKNFSSYDTVASTFSDTLVPFTGSTTYYTGFNTDTSYGGYSSSGIVIPQNSSYRSSVTLQWEPRVGQGQATMNGSWVVIGSTNITV